MNTYCGPSPNRKRNPSTWNYCLVRVCRAVAVAIGRELLRPLSPPIDGATSAIAYTMTIDYTLTSHNNGNYYYISSERQQHLGNMNSKS